MAYVLWEICRHEGAEQRIREELRTSISEKMRPLSLGSGLTPFLPPSPETLDQLPYLNAVIRESLRLRNTAPTPNPRLTPMNETTKIGTYDGIPGGVRISGFAWCLHRQEDVFEHSEEWDPDRWLSSDKQKLAEMNKWDWTFGSGSRMCLGKNLAWQCK
jgi:cytochrome P450